MSTVVAKDEEERKMVVFDLCDCFLHAILEVFMLPDIPHRSTSTPGVSTIVIAFVSEPVL